MAAHREARYSAPPQLAIAANATTPDPGVNGVVVWSTSTGTHLVWDGVAWRTLTPIYVGSSAPSSPMGGLVWIDTSS